MLRMLDKRTQQREALLVQGGVRQLKRIWKFQTLNANERRTVQWDTHLNNRTAIALIIACRIGRKIKLPKFFKL